MPLKLYSRYRNSAGQRVRTALNLKGVTYEYVPLASIGKDAYRKINPQVLLPALDTGKAVLTQSTAILEYIEETWPEPPLLPQDPVLRAQIRAFGQIIACEIHPLHNHRVRDYLEDDYDWTNDMTMDWYLHWLREGFKDLEVVLEQRPEQSRYAFSDTPTMADLYLVPHVFNARYFSLDMSPYPLLDATFDTCMEHPAFIAAAPENQPDYPEDPPKDGS